MINPRKSRDFATAGVGLWIVLCLCVSAMPVGAVTLRVKGLLSGGASNKALQRFDQWATIVADLTCGADERDFVGVLQVEQLNRSDTVLRVDVSLPTSSAKRYFLHIPPTYISTEYTVTLLDRSGREVETYQLGTDMLDPANDLVALVGDGAAVALRLPPPEDTAYKVGTRVIQLGVDELPDAGWGLSPVTMLVVADPESIAWTPARVEPLRHYVARGGLLVLNGGRPAYNPALDILAPARANGRTEARPWAALAGWAGSAATLPAEPVVCTRLEPAGDVLLHDGALPLITARLEGAGRVAALAFDLVASQTMDEWAGVRRLTRQLLWLACDTPYHNNFFSGWMLGHSPHASAAMRDSEYSLSDTVLGARLDRILRIEAYLRWIIALIMVLYLALIGPVNFFFLRHRNQMLLTWYTAPAAAILTTGMIGLAGLSLGVRESQLVGYSMLRASEGGTTAWADGIFVALAKHSRTLEVKGDDAACAQPFRVWLPETNVSGSNVIDQSSGGSLRMPLRAGVPDYVGYDAAVALDGHVRSELVWSEAGLIGEIVNDTPLALLSPSLRFGRELRLLKARLEPGERVPVAIPPAELARCEPLIAGGDIFVAPDDAVSDDLMRKSVALACKSSGGRLFLTAFVERNAPLQWPENVFQREEVTTLVVALRDPVLAATQELLLPAVAMRSVYEQDAFYSDRLVMNPREQQAIPNAKQLKPMLRAGSFVSRGIMLEADCVCMDWTKGKSISTAQSIRPRQPVNRTNLVRRDDAALECESSAANVWLLVAAKDKNVDDPR